MNPFKSPPAIDTGTQSLELVGRIRDATSYAITALLTGGIAGAALPFLYSFFVLVPLWGPPLFKSDGRMQILCFIASTVMPLLVVSGIVVSAIVIAINSYRLQYSRILIGCFILWLLISAQRPHVSRVRRPEIPDPTYETIPDLMTAAVCSVFIAALVFGIIQWLSVKAGSTG